MNLNITFRHMDPSQTTKDYAIEKIGRLKRYFDGLVEGNIVFSQEKIRHQAEVTLLVNGVRINAKDETVDFHTAIDNVVDKLERQLKRFKEKLKRHKPLRNRERRGLQETVYAYESFEEEIPRVIQTEHYDTHPLSVEEAVMEMDLSDRSFLVFTDVDEKVKVLYRREDGNYGLIDPK